jgi:hypothetical protein
VRDSCLRSGHERRGRLWLLRFNKCPLLRFFQSRSSACFNVVQLPITPVFVLSSPLDGTSILSPDVTVNQDTAGAPQNETAIAVDPAQRTQRDALRRTSKTARLSTLGERYA